jgi:hypothetical protein
MIDRPLRAGGILTPVRGRLVIVIPTRNRADIAQVAVRSVLAADEPDVRVIVSDNSTDHAAVQTLQAACAALDDERVAYVRPPASLTMTDHWSWALDRALEDPHVAYVSYLTDRNLFARGELRHVLAAVDAVPGQIVTYNQESIDDADDPVRIVVNESSGLLLALPSRELIHATARGARFMALPRMLNSVVPRTVLEAVRERFGSVFASVAPDYAFGFRALATMDTIAFLDRPVLFHHATARSNGMSQILGIASPDSTDFERLMGAQMYAHTPAPQLRTVSNAIFNEYCFVRAEAPDAFPPLMRRDYLGCIARDIDDMKEPALAELTRAQLHALGWTARDERQRQAREIASLLRFYAPRPRMALSRALRAATGRTYGAPRLAPSTEAAIVDLESRPVPLCGDLALLRPLINQGARIEVLQSVGHAP